MCDITAYDIELLIKTKSFIEKPEYFTDEEWNLRVGDIEGSQFDLTIDKLYAQSPSSSPYLGRYGRDTGSLVELEAIKFPKINEEGWQLYPETHYVGLTGELINMPNDLRGLLDGRSSDFVIGIYPGVTNISPGYSGKLKFGVFAASGAKLCRGARVLTVTFTSFNYYGDRPKMLNAHIQPYGGIWGGDKVTTEGVERPS